MKQACNFVCYDCGTRVVVGYNLRPKKRAERKPFCNKHGEIRLGIRDKQGMKI